MMCRADQEALQDVQQLPTPTVEQLLSARPGTAMWAHALWGMPSPAPRSWRPPLTGSCDASGRPAPIGLTR